MLEEDVWQAAYDVDALTVNGYLGIDGISPMIDDCILHKKGILFWLKHQPSSIQLQDIVVEDGRKVYEVVADSVSNGEKT